MSLSWEGELREGSRVFVVINRSFRGHDWYFIILHVEEDAQEKKKAKCFDFRPIFFNSTIIFELLNSKINEFILEDQ